jgi:hypothetical protein
MALSEIFFLAIAFYLLYRFVFNFLLPVARTTKHVRQQFRNMQEMQDAMRQQSQGQPQSMKQRPGEGPGPAQGPGSGQGQRPAQRPPADEYIDFEEIKD